MKVSRNIFGTTTLIVATTLCVSCDKRDLREDRSDSATALRATKVKRLDGENNVAARTKFESELEAVTAISDPTDRNSALIAMAASTMENRPDLAQLALRQVLPNSPEFQGLLTAYLTATLESGVTETTKWIESLEDPAMVEVARGVLLDLLPDEQLALAVSQTLNGSSIAAKGFKREDGRILQRWASTDPQGTAAWLVKMPMGDARNEGFRIVSESVVQIDEYIAVNWLNSLPSENLRANARKSMAKALIEVPEPIREAMLGSPESELRRQLGEEIGRLLPLPEEALLIDKSEPADQYSGSIQTGPERTEEENP